MEVLGGAASVFSVASLAIQVCEELKKVHAFWQSVKEAPEDIARISTEIKLFMTWLSIIANNYQRKSFNHRNLNEAAATDTLKLCLATVHDMNDGVKDLESGFSRGSLSRRWASVKFVFRKDKREKVIDQMERMKSLLMIVQTCYVAEMQEAGFESLSLSLRPKDSALQATSNEQSLDMSTTASANEDLVIETRPSEPIPNSSVEMVSFDPTASPQVPRRPRHRTTRQEMGGFYNFGLAMLRFVTMEQESILIEESGIERRVPTRRTRYDLRIAQWLLSCGFSWQSFGTYGSWQYSFRTFRYIPEDALVVDFCIEGDLANVQRMFDKGLASPFDRVMLKYEFRSNGGVVYLDEDWSLLHFSIIQGHAPLCKFLIECGLGRSSASGWLRQDWTKSNPAAHLDILRIMINEGQYDPMEEADHSTVMHQFEGSSTVFRWLLDQEEFLIDLEQTAVTMETIAAALINSDQLNASKSLEAAIAHGSDLNDPAGRNFLGDGLTLAHRAAWSSTCLADNMDFPERIKVLWDAGADFHTPEPHNPFGTTLNYLFQCMTITIFLDHSERTKYYNYGVEQRSIPTPSRIYADVIDYDRLEDISAIKHHPRISRSQWHEWYPGCKLSILEVVQRALDAWMEILLEAGLDIADYGRREERLHPEGILSGPWGEARVHFEYGDHVSGCRIHVIEMWVFDPPVYGNTVYGSDRETEATSVEASTMPCSWNVDDL